TAAYPPSIRTSTVSTEHLEHYAIAVCRRNVLFRVGWINRFAWSRNQAATDVLGPIPFAFQHLAYLQRFRADEIGDHFQQFARNEVIELLERIVQCLDGDIGGADGDADEAHVMAFGQFSRRLVHRLRRYPQHHHRIAWNAQRRWAAHG